MVDYQYTECGLPNVIIENAKIVTDDAGEKVVHIPKVNQLHKEIARAIVKQISPMSPAELRFLRTEMGLTQAELAKFVHRDEQTIRRWEQGKHPMDPAAEALVRVATLERIEVERPSAVEVARAFDPKADKSDTDEQRHVIKSDSLGGHEPLEAA